MRLKLKPKSIPRNWAKLPGMDGLILESDIPIGYSRLRAKLLIFDAPKNLRRFWKGPLGKSDLGRHCKGAVNGLFEQVIAFHKNGTEKEWIEADPRYFCVIGLVKGHLYGEVICHEAVHAAFNYVKRVRRSPWEQEAKSFDEEAICYPAGRIAAEISNIVHKYKLA